MGERPGGATARLALLVGRLEAVQHAFRPLDRAVKHRNLLTLARRTIADGRLLLRLHEALCFMRAYPDDVQILGLVEAALAGFPKRVAELAARQARVLEETGVAGTTVCCPLSYPAARWLAARYPESVELDWDDAVTEERLATLLPLLVDGLDEEALVEVGVPYRAWLTAGKGDARRSDLAWLLDRLERAPRARARGCALYDCVQPRLAWALGESAASRTLAKLPVSRVFFHRSALLPRGGPLGRRLPGPPVPVRTATHAEAMALLDAALAAVIVRFREVHSLNHADPADVVVARAGRGVVIAWFGVLAEHRLPLRAHYGYLLLKNGVPVGYGDASLLFDWCEIAFNIFETFRRGESAFLFERLLAFACQRLGARTFLLSPYQLGHDNDEALASGAFWFYYKLGFRPTRPDVSALAEAERRRIAREPGARSSRETLGRLAESRMVLAVGGPVDPAIREFDPGRVARRAASAASSAGIGRALDGGRRRAWLRAERVALERLEPILALIPDLARWPGPERRALVDLVRAKGGRPELEYLRRLRAHPRLRSALLELGKSSPGEDRPAR